MSMAAQRERELSLEMLQREKRFNINFPALRDFRRIDEQRRGLLVAILRYVRKRDRDREGVTEDLDARRARRLLGVACARALEGAE